MPFNPFEPLLPKAAIKPPQDKIDNPNGNYGVGEAQLRGFGAGALEGLRGMTSPVELAGLVGGVGMKAVGKLAPVVAEAAPPAGRAAMAALQELYPVEHFEPWRGLHDVQKMMGWRK